MNQWRDVTLWFNYYWGCYAIIGYEGFRKCNLTQSGGRFGGGSDAVTTTFCKLFAADG